VREQYPEFGRATALFAYREQAGTFGAYSSADPRGRFLRAVGFRPPERIDELAGDQFFASISGEQLRLLDEDVLVLIDLAKVAAEPAELMKDPLFRRLDVVRDGRDVYPEVEPAAALSFSSPLSLPLAIDAIVPQLAQAVEQAR
jgi:iron complex transport system substrate-binding protein